MGKEAKTVRINSRIGKTHNDYLDKYSHETGISKSSLIMMAVDFWVSNREATSLLEEALKKLKEEEN